MERTSRAVRRGAHGPGARGVVLLGLMLGSPLVGCQAPIPARALDGLVLAREALDAGRPAEAERRVQAYRNDPKFQAEAHEILVRALLEQGRAREALDVLEEVPGDTSPRLFDELRLEALRALELPAASFVVLDRMLARDPSDTDVAYRRAEVLVELSRFEEAAQALSELRVTDPRNAKVWTASLVVARELDHTDEVQRLLQNLPPSLRAEPGLLFERALDQERSGDLDAAARSYRELLRIAPEHFGAACNLALLEERRGRISPALHAWERALALAPDERTKAQVGEHLAQVRATRPTAPASPSPQSDPDPLSGAKPDPNHGRPPEDP